MMKRTSAELKRLSREQLNGHWALAIGANLLAGVITSAIWMPFYFLLLITGQGVVQLTAYLIAVVFIAAVSVVLQCGILRMQFGFARNEEVSVGMIFAEFTRRPDRYILAYLLLFAIEFVCVLPGAICFSIGVVTGAALAVAIGIFLYLMGMALMLVIAFRLSQVFLLMLNYSEMGVIEAYRESTNLMEGNKGRLFYIYLSFIGWSVLGMLSCGIGMLWITPYLLQVTVNFYRELTGELDQNPEFDQMDASGQEMI